MEDVTFKLHTFYPDTGKVAPPVTPVTVREDETYVRLLLGDPEKLGTPDIYVERYNDSWAVFIHANGGGDPAYHIVIHDGDKAEHGSSKITVEDENGQPVSEWVNDASD